MDPLSAEAQHAAALRRANRTRDALEQARIRSVDAHVALRAAEANARANPSQQANDAVEIARYDASVADNAHREAQAEAVSAHAALSNTNFNARHAGVTHTNGILEQTTANQKPYSDVEELPSQNDSNREKDGSTQWKGKGKAEKSDAPSADRKHSLYSLYQQPIEAAKRILHIGDFNEQYPDQRLERSQSLRNFPSPNPLYKYPTKPRESPVVRGRFGGPHLRKVGKDKPTTTTDRPASVHVGGAQIDTTGGLGIANNDGTGDGNASSSQPTRTGDTQTSAAGGSGPDNQNGVGNGNGGGAGGGNGGGSGGGNGGGSEEPPKQDETGKKQGTLRKASSKLWGKLKRKK